MDFNKTKKDSFTHGEELLTHPQRPTLSCRPLLGKICFPEKFRIGLRNTKLLPNTSFGLDPLLRDVIGKITPFPLTSCKRGTCGRVHRLRSLVNDTLGFFTSFLGPSDPPPRSPHAPKFRGFPFFFGPTRLAVGYTTSGNWTRRS